MLATLLLGVWYEPSPVLQKEPKAEIGKQKGCPRTAEA
jgi:hypothetical protein